MPKFFILPEQIKGGMVRIEGEDARHLKTVLRCKIGETVTLCDGHGWDYDCEVTALEKDSILGSVKKIVENQTEPKAKITLFQGLPKGEKMDWVIQKAVELGVDEIVPMATKRAVVKLEKKDKEEKKVQRWQKIALGAAQQSGRGKIPKIGNVLEFSQALEKARSLDGAMIGYEKEEGFGIREFLQQGQWDSLGVMIGPEGGFEQEEVAMAQELGIVPVTLGKRILRTETAALAALAVLFYELG